MTRARPHAAQAKSRQARTWTRWCVVALTGAGDRLCFPLGLSEQHAIDQFENASANGWRFDRKQYRTAEVRITELARPRGGKRKGGG